MAAEEKQQLTHCLHFARLLFIYLKQRFFLFSNARTGSKVTVMNLRYTGTFFHSNTFSYRYNVNPVRSMRRKMVDESEYLDFLLSRLC